MLPKVFLSEDINPLGKELLKGKADLIIAPDTSKETAIRLMKGVTGVILRATTIFDAEVIAHSTELKVIARTGVGVDNIDVEAASEKGILVCNFPGMNDLTVAEHTIALIMSLAKRIVHMNHAVKTDNWIDRFSPDLIEVEGKTLGVIGMGRIGRLVAKKCTDGLGMNVLAYDPYCISKNTLPFSFTSQLEELFLKSDFITIHIPNLPETKNLVTRDLLAVMKKTAFLVNTSRGEIIDEPSLVEALINNRIKGAALDVFLKEPLPANNPLNALDNVILSPHCAGSTWESNVRISIGAAQAVLDVIEGRKPKECYIYNITKFKL